MKSKFKGMYLVLLLFAEYSHNCKIAGSFYIVALLLWSAFVLRSSFMFSRWCCAIDCEGSSDNSTAIKFKKRGE